MVSLYASHRHGAWPGVVSRVTSPSILEKCCLLTEAAGGDPTHYMMEQSLEQADLDWRFASFEINPDELETALRGLDVLGFRGVKLASSFRVPAALLLPHLTSRARVAQSVTCLVRQNGLLVGDELLGDAFVQGITSTTPLAEAPTTRTPPPGSWSGLR